MIFSTVQLVTCTSSYPQIIIISKKKSEMIEKSIDGISKWSVVSFVQENEKKI